MDNIHKRQFKAIINTDDYYSAPRYTQHLTGYGLTDLIYFSNSIIY